MKTVKIKIKNKNTSSDSKSSSHRKKSDVFLKQVKGWILSHPKDFKNYSQVSTEEIDEVLENYNKTNTFFYDSLKKFHSLKKEEKKEKKSFQSRYKAIITEIETFYKKDDKINDFKVGKRGVLMDEKLKKLKKAFLKHKSQLEKKIKFSFSDIEELFDDFFAMQKKIENAQKEILKSRESRAEVFKKIRIFAQRYRHIILARYAGEPHKKKAFTSI